MADSFKERRKSHRVDANLNLNVKIPQADGSQESATLETINISSSGVYFKSDHFMEPMTKLAMDLEVLVPSESGDDRQMAMVPCEGLVVRCDPEAETTGCDHYEIAVFFTFIEPDGLAALESHIGLLIDNIE
jgi:hypothetical protein